MAVQTESVAKVIKSLNEAERSDEKCKILTSLCRTLKEETNLIVSYKDEEFSELCGVLINFCTNEEKEVHTEACQILDILLPETRNRNFDFFQSILQINRKKRLKILQSISEMEDLSVAAIAQKESILQFFKDCMQSIQPAAMKWLSMECADNIEVVQKAESTSLTEDQELEDNIVQQTLKLLDRLHAIPSFRNNIQMFDTFIMDKVVTLAYMGHRKQRTLPLNILQQAAAANLAVRLRTDYRDLWMNYKTTLQNTYCKRMSKLVVVCEPDWATQWTLSTQFVGTDLHRGSGLVNSLLRVEEIAFKSADSDVRRQAFLSWKVLIDNFALDPLELATQRRIKLLCVPLNAKNSKTEMMAVTKLGVWWHLTIKLYPDLTKFVNFVLTPFLNFCFGPLGDSPTLVTRSDSSAQPGKKFVATQVIAIDALFQLLVSEKWSGVLEANLSERVPHAVQNAVLAESYKSFIYSLGEAIIILSQLSDKDIKNRHRVAEVLWLSLMDRIKTFEQKIKVPMYKECVLVATELCKCSVNNDYVKNLVLDVILKSFAPVSESLQFSDDSLKDLLLESLKIDDFSNMKKDHCEAIEGILLKIVKPHNTLLNNPSTLQLLWILLEKLRESQVTQSNMPVLAEFWHMLAVVAAKYMENSNKIVESTTIDQNFKTIENLIAYPFSNIFLEDEAQIIRLTSVWKTMYKHFDFQADLIVSIMPNEILNKTTSMILGCLKKDKRCCAFASHCLDGLLSSVNYNTILDSDVVPPVTLLLSHLTTQAIKEKTATAELVLKSLSAFLITVFGLSAEKASVYLKVVEPAMYSLIAHNSGELDREISNTWETVIGIFRGLHKYLTFELVSTYRKVIVDGLNHANADIASHTSTLVDLREGLDTNVQKLLDDISAEAIKCSKKKTTDVKDSFHSKEKIKIKPVGSFLHRKSMSPSTRVEKEITKPKILPPDPDSQDYVVIHSEVKYDVNCLTEHQKEMLKKRRDDIPTMYNDLSQSSSQDTQQLQKWFDITKENGEVNGKESVIDITESPKAESPKNELSESVAKKLDFESLDEFPEEKSDGVKRKSDKEAEKEDAAKRRKSLRKSTTTEKRGVKRKASSDSESESGGVRRKKKLNSPDSDGDKLSEGTSEENLTRRQKVEIQRLHIDMVFDRPLPSRRSAGKSSDGEPKGPKKLTDSDKEKKRGRPSKKESAEKELARKLVDVKSPGKESETKKLEETVDIQIEEVPSPDKTENNLDNSAESDIAPETNQESEDDIVESSQEPTLKMDKVNEKKCFIKINKIESPPITVPDTEKVEKVKENEEVADLPKKAENLPAIKAANLLNTSSPKSTINRFKTKSFPLQGRAAQMLGLVTKKNLSDKMDLKESEDPVVTKKEKIMFNEKIGSPSAGSRQVKIFNNMKTAGSCPSPPMKLFGNLRNDGEKISPKLEKHLTEDISMEEIHSEDNRKKELPMLEWSNANPPSLTASPSASILKRVSLVPGQEADTEVTPNKKKRVSFADPPVSKEMGYEVASIGSPTRVMKLASCRSLQRKDSPLRPKQLKFRMIQMESEIKLFIPDVSKDNLDKVIGGSETMEITDVSGFDIPPTFEPEVKQDDIAETQDLFDATQDVKVATPNDSVTLPPVNPDDFQCSVKETALEDTIDVNSSGLNSTSNSDETFSKPVRTSTAEADTLPITDSIVSQLLMASQDTQTQEVSQVLPSQPEELDDTVPVYPSLTTCEDPIQSIVKDLTNPLWTGQLSNYFSNRGVMCVGDLAKLTEREINRMPVKGNSKAIFVKNVLSRFERTKNMNTPIKSTKIVPSSTPLGGKSGESVKSQESKNGDYLEVMEPLESVSALESSIFAPPFPSLEGSIRAEDFEKQNSTLEVQNSVEDSLNDINIDLVLQKCTPEVLLAHFKAKVRETTEKETREKLLNNVLTELPEIFSNEEFFSRVFSKYHKRFQVQEYLDTSDDGEMKEAIAQKFSTTELADILSTSLEEIEKKGDVEPAIYASTLSTIWKRMPTESLVSHIKNIPKEEFMEIYKAATERLGAELSATELFDLSYGFLRAKLESEKKSHS